MISETDISKKNKRLLKKTRHRHAEFKDGVIATVEDEDQWYHRFKNMMVM